ncbi:MAG TPA: dienelactone hydrolase family protein [Thermoanaerobaculia bacterium]|nr:dienelactone hydrolase family protein [Thermoanaerobaculia bacterium]
MRNRIILVTLALILGACAHTGDDTAARLETTPRHDEWVTIDSGGRPLHAYVVYPQRSRKAGAVLVIHENRGLTDWVRTVADRLAERGYIAIAPDFLSGAAPGGGRTSDFPTSDAAREAISKLSRDQVMTDLANAANYVRTLPSANGKLAVAGFCWGGSRTFEFANVGENIAASFVFYGTGPRDDAGVTGIDSPVYGFYGGADERVNATIETTRAAMERNGKKYEPVIYEGAGHAFMRLGEEPNPSEANKKARDEAWSRWLGLLFAIE